jgi:hypothetical protein
MPIQIRKVVRPLALRGLAQEYEDDFISVWVNPNREMLARFEVAREETEQIKKQLSALASQKKADPEKIREISDGLDQANQLLYAWYAEIWSQGEDARHHVMAEGVEAWARTADPALWLYLTSGSWRLINDHLAHAKKG